MSETRGYLEDLEIAKKATKPKPKTAAKKTTTKKAAKK